MPERRLFRIVHSPDAPWQDFVSDEAKCAPPRPEQRRDMRLYRGISMLSSLTAARRRVRDFPVLGSWIAELRFPEVDYLELRKTLGPSHYTVIGLPRILASLVRRVHPGR